MSIIRMIVWLCLASLLVASHCYAQDVQYYWVKPNKVFLWKSVEDTQPVSATFEPVTLNWTITPNPETAKWQKILEDLAYKHYSTLKLDAYKNENKLLDLMLTKLHNDYPNIPWATAREPFAQIFWQSEPGQGVRIVFLTKAAPATPNNVRSFTLKNDRWQKGGGDINLVSLLNVNSDPTSLRAVFNLPRSTAQTNDWSSAWHEFADANFQGEQVRPITYQDKDSKWQWIWWENKESGALPTKYAAIPKPPSIREPVPANVGGDVIPPVKTWAEIIRIIALVILGTALIAATVAAFINRRKLWKYVSTLIGNDDEKNALAKTSTDGRIISLDGLNLLHNHALALVQGLPHEKVIKGKVTTSPTVVDLDDAGRNHLVQVLNWSHEQYLKIINSAQFRDKVAPFKKEVLEAHYKEIGIDPSETENIPGWIILGRTFEEKIKSGEITGSSFVGNFIKQQYPAGLKSREDWMESWSKLVIGLGALAEKQQGELDEARRELAKTEKEKKGEQQRMVKEWEGKVKSVNGELEILKTAHNQAHGLVEKLQLSEKTLKADLQKSQTQVDETTKELEKAEISLTKYKDLSSEIQEVKKLSRVIRQLIQGYFETQRDSTGNMRSVGLMATLVNYSLYQMCFSIFEEHQPMRKAMAQNLFTFARIFSKNAHYSSVLDSLKRIDPKVETAFDEQTNAAGSTIDDPLFQACLKSLQTDTGFNLGPFFIDEKENKINLVNAS